MKFVPLLITLLRVCLGAILLFAGLSKVMALSIFAQHLAGYALLPMSWVLKASYLLISTEITLGVLLILGHFTQNAAMLAASLFVSFALAIASALWRNLPMDGCGCSNPLFDWLGLSEGIGWKTVALDVALALGCCVMAGVSHLGYGLDLLRRHVADKQQARLLTP